jgi:hypothetical protein
MTIDYVALKTEIQTDPKSLGYAPFMTAGSDWQIANLLNTQGASNEKVNQRALAPGDVFGAIVPSEWAVVSADNKLLIQIAFSLNAIDLNNANIRALFSQAFGVGSTTRANIVALVQRSASRAEALFGVGTFITPDDVAKALRAS